MRTSILLASLMLTILTGCASRPQRVAATPRIGEPHVTVMTFNVNYGLAGETSTLEAIGGAGADVVLLQETNEAWEAALRSSLTNAYPHMAFEHDGAAGGLAVLSKLPLTYVERLAKEDWFPAMRIELATPVGPLQVLNVHLRPPISDGGSPVSGYLLTPPVREREIEAFAKSLDPNLPTIVCGDFNEPEAGRALTWLRENRDMKSALPEFSPYAKTWRWQTSVVTLKGRYDHLVYDARLTPVDVHVVEAGQSDHLPVVGVFTLTNGAVMK